MSLVVPPAENKDEKKEEAMDDEPADPTSVEVLDELPRTFSDLPRPSMTFPGPLWPSLALSDLL